MSISEEARRSGVMSTWVRRAIVLAAVSLAAGTAFGISRGLPFNESAGGRERVAVVPSGFGSRYERAVARMTRINHLYEERQALLSYALQWGAPPSVVAHLRREVAWLERRYDHASEAIIDAARHSAGGAPVSTTG